MRVTRLNIISDTFYKSRMTRLATFVPIPVRISSVYFHLFLKNNFSNYFLLTLMPDSQTRVFRKNRISSCVCASIHAYVHAYEYLCACICVYMYVYEFVCMCEYVYVSVYTCMCLCVCACVCMCKCECMYV